MSQSKTKKVRKEIRRELSKKFEGGMAVLGEIVRPRPKWIPKSVWAMLYLPLFPRKYVRIIKKHIK